MSNLKDFDWTGFWNDVDYAFESYIGKPVTDKDIKDAEAELGYTFLQHILNYLTIIMAVY